MSKFNTIFRILIIAPLAFIYSCSRVEPATAQQVKPVSSLLVKKVVITYNDTSVMQFVNDEALYTEGWDTLPQPQFWKRVMRLSPDSAIVNIADNRNPLLTIDFNAWMKQTESEKALCKENYCCSNNIDCFTDLYVTKGRRDFFEHRKSLLSVSKAIGVFVKNGVDPWYAETILLIESPGKSVQKSWAGAQGPFQLMRDVATRFGLKVNKKMDERTDLMKSADAASQLISRICIPKVRNILDSLDITYNETDTWFRLMVLHAYHAGPGNVACAVYSIAPKKGGMELIQKMWRTECRGFKNESQNYSQLALAAHLSFNEIIGRSHKDTVFLVQGDRQYALYKEEGKPLSIPELSHCFNLYGDDLVDGIIDAEYYIKRINQVKKEMAVASPTATENDYLIVSNELLRKKKVDDAIKLLRFTMEQYPQSSVAADSLSRAYKLNGNTTLAQKYELMSTQLEKNNP